MMTDLYEAGQRLRALAVPPTPVAVLEARNGRRRRRRRLAGGAAAVGVAAATVAVVLVAVSPGHGVQVRTATPATGPTVASLLPDVSLAIPAVLPTSAARVFDAPTAAFDAASRGLTVAKLPNGYGISKQPPLTANAKPEILYIEAGYCPYCAAENWPLVAALAKFGTFHNLGSGASSATDINPLTPTFNFYNSTYTSPYLTFTSVELTTQDETVPLQTPTAAQTRLWKALDPNQVIPFIDFGNQYRISGATYTSSSMSKKTFESVAAQVANNSSAAGKGIDQAAGAMIKAICQMTANLPAQVCTAIAS